MSVVHVSEVADIIEERIPTSECRRIISDIVTKRSVEVVDVSKNLYTTSLQTTGVHDFGVNEALASTSCKERDVDEIYSFDRHFWGAGGGGVAA